MRAKAEHGADLLQILPGEHFFGRGRGRLATLLGSCVAVTLWHPTRRIGGMCHFLLPSRPGGRHASQPLDGRYGDEALTLLVDAARRAGTDLADYETHLYGGADTLPDDVGGTFDIGERNIAQGWSLIDQHGLALHSVDVGDAVPRTVRLSLVDGSVSMARGRPVNQRKN